MAKLVTQCIGHTIEFAFIEVFERFGLIHQAKLQISNNSFLN